MMDKQLYVKYFTNLLQGTDIATQELRPFVHACALERGAA